MTSKTCTCITLLITILINFIYIEGSPTPSLTTKIDNLRVELITNPKTAHTTAACDFKRRLREVTLKFRIYTDKIIHDTTYIHVRDLKTGQKIELMNEHCFQDEGGNSTVQIIGCFAWEIYGDDFNYSFLYDGTETRKYKVWLTRDQNPNLNIIWETDKPFDLAENIFGCIRHSLKRVKFKDEQLNSVGLVWAVRAHAWLFKPKFKVLINDEVSGKPYKCDRRCRQTLYDIKPEKEYKICVRIEYEFNFLQTYFPKIPDKCITKNGTGESLTTRQPILVLDQKENQIILWIIVTLILFIMIISVIVYVCKRRIGKQNIAVVEPRAALEPPDLVVQVHRYTEIPEQDKNPKQQNKSNETELKDSEQLLTNIGLEVNLNNDQESLSQQTAQQTNLRSPLTELKNNVYIENVTTGESTETNPMMNYDRKLLSQQRSRDTTISQSSSVDERMSLTTRTNSAGKLKGFLMRFGLFNSQRCGQDCKQLLKTK